MNCLQIFQKNGKIACYLRKMFSNVFQPIPYVDELPLEPLAWITLKDAEKIIKTRNYACPWKWKDAWYTLLQQHLDAG